MRIRGGSIPPATAKPFIAPYNGKPSNVGGYQIGFAASGDRVHWHTRGAPIISASSGWESTDVFHPWLIWDGSQYVVYYAAQGTKQQIGRATASNLQDPSTITKYGSNPVIANGSAGTPDINAANGPVVYYDSGLSPAWKMWYAGSNGSNVFTVCFADSTDGITWTKRGSMIGTGAGGSFNETGAVPGCVSFDGSTWTVFIAGINAAGNYHGGYATCTNPASSGTYSALSQLTNYTGNITIGGRTWQKNQPRGIVPVASGYRCFISLFAPTDTSTILEACITVTSADLTSWSTPSDLMLPFTDWDAVSAENPSVLVAH